MKTARAIDTTELIGRIYDSVGEPEALSQAIMEIVHLTRSRGAQYGILDQGGKWLQAWSVGIDVSIIQSYITKYELVDPRTAYWLSHPGEIVPCQQTVADQERHEHSALVNEFLNKVDSRYALASITPAASGISVGFGVMRARRDGPYGEHELKTMTPLLYHIVRAMALHIRLGRLQSQAGSLEAMVDKLATPVILLDQAGMLRYANTAGHEALAKGTYLVLVRPGRVAARNSRQQGDFQQAIAAALEPASHSAGLDSHPPGALRLQGSDGRAALLMIHALTGQRDLVGLPQAHAALFLTSCSETPTPDPIRLQHIFDLTPAETRLVEHLLNGESLNEIAERVRVSRETLRSQLRSLFTKTDTRRQAELIARLLGAVSVPLV